MEERAVYRILNFALRAGDVMLGSGGGTVEVESTILTLVQACGLVGCEVDVTFTSLTVSYVRATDVEPVTAVRVVRHRDVDYGKLTAIHMLRDDVAAGRFDMERAWHRLHRIAGAQPRRSRLIVFGWAGMAAAFTVLLGGTEVVAAVAFFSTIISVLFSHWLGRRGMLSFFQTVASAGVATGAALALAALHLPYGSSLVVAGGIMVLVPGYSLVASVQDALTGFPISGAARGLEVLLTASGIVTGIALMLYLGSVVGVSIGVVAVTSAPLVQVPLQVAAAGVASALYATATSVPKRALVWSGVMGAAGWAIALLLQHGGVEEIFATTVAAWAVGVGSRILADRQRVHPFQYIVPGIMPLVPGLTIYAGMLSLVQGQRADGFTELLRALATGLAIAAGVLLGHVVIRPLRRLHFAAIHHDATTRNGPAAGGETAAAGGTVAGEESAAGTDAPAGDGQGPEHDTEPRRD